jgi:phosphoribosyl 1,2-cyclic phosphate phosphodiesterase
MKLTFLGTGTSVGVPMIGCDCATCQSDDPRDRRLRTGLLIENEGQFIQIDISADFRQQALRVGLQRLDALLITHCHADHVFGLDDVRPLNFKHQRPIPVYASASTWRQLRRVFYYIFEREHVGGGLPQLAPHEFSEPFQLAGLEVTPLPLIHGKSEVTAFRFTDGRSHVAFVTDCNEIPASTLAQLHDLDLLILDALRLKPHPTHLHLDQSLAYVNELKPRRALLTHIGHDIRYGELNAQLPAGVELAYDELRVEL